jgi:hypothetical protein
MLSGVLAWVHRHWWLTLSLVLVAAILALAVGGFVSVVTTISLEARRAKARRRRTKAALRAALRANLSVLRRVASGAAARADGVALESALHVGRGALAPEAWAEIEKARAALLVFERALQVHAAAAGRAGGGVGGDPGDELRRAAVIALRACMAALAALDSERE